MVFFVSGKNDKRKLNLDAVKNFEIETVIIKTLKRKRYHLGGW
jgi:hypothetical protein